MRLVRLLIFRSLGLVGGRMRRGSRPCPPNLSMLGLSTAAFFFVLTTAPFPSFADGAIPVQAAGGMSPAGSGRVVILHMYDGASFFRRLGHMTGVNKERYAARHGYEMVVRSPESVKGLWKERDCPTGESPPCWEEDHDFQIDKARAATFGKLKLAMAACNNRDGAWLLWSDADALIVNQTVPLESIIDDAYDIAVSFDWLMLQAGVILFKCSPFTKEFLHKVYNDRSFDTARALDQSALQDYMDKLTPAERDTRIKFLPKYAMNVYLEEYRAGDFLIHMAGKLYEATEPGLWAIANQLDLFSMVAEQEDIEAFMSTPYLLNQFSGVCNVNLGERQSSCPPDDPRRIKLKEPLGAMSSPNRYKHVALRYYFLPNWEDKYDVPNWKVKRRALGKPIDAPPAPVEPKPPVVDVDGDQRGGGHVHNTPPRIDLVRDHSPKHRDAQGHDSGATIPEKNSTSYARWIALFVAFVVALAAVLHLAHVRRQRLTLKKQ